MKSRPDELLKRSPVVVNIGVGDFAETLRRQSVRVIQVNWSPPAGGDTEMMNLLGKLL